MSKKRSKVGTNGQVLIWPVRVNVTEREVLAIARVLRQERKDAGTPTGEYVWPEKDWREMEDVLERIVSVAAVVIGCRRKVVKQCCQETYAKFHIT